MPARASTPLSRNHHHVAQAYQRGFARKRGRSWQLKVVERATGEWFVSSTRNVFAATDWNTVKDADGTKDDVIEGILAEHIDGPAAKVLATLRDEEPAFPLPDDARSDLARFMSVQLGRGRRVRENLSRFVVGMHSHMLALKAQHYTPERWERELGHAPTPEFIEQLHDIETYFDTVPTNALLLDTLLANTEEVASYIVERRWTLVCFEEPCLFSSEHPVVFVNPSHEQMGYGVATAEKLYLPVSPTRALVMSLPWASWPECIVHGTDALARRLNWATLTLPTSERLLMHPDVAAHPLPGPTDLPAVSGWPDDDERVFAQYLLDGPARPRRGED